MKRSEQQNVAVIMRSKNEQPYAEKALEALSLQSFRNFTLYNVDSGSTDGTLEAIYHWNSNPKNIYQIQPQEYVPGKVLNQMISKTTEEIIVFLNADAIPLHSDWLEKLIQPIIDKQADATMSLQVPRKDAYFLVDYDYSRTYSPKTIQKMPYFFSAVSCAFSRKLWEDTKFYTMGYTEDSLWCKMCKKKGARFLYVNDSIVEHSHNYSLKQLFQRFIIEGDADVLIHGIKPSVLNESYGCIKEIIRDLYYAGKKGKIHTIPFNVIYRVVQHLGRYRGQIVGKKRWKNIQLEDLKSLSESSQKICKKSFSRH